MILDRDEAVRLVLSLDAVAWGLAHRALRRTRRGDLADYHRAAVAGLWEAATRYDPARGHQFEKYAGFYARKWVSKLIRHEAARGVHVPQQRPVTRFDVVPFGAFGDSRDQPYDVPARESAPVPDARGFWAAVRKAIPDVRFRDAVVRYYRDGEMDKQIAARAGIARNSATGRRRRGEELLVAAGAARLAEFVV